MSKKIKVDELFAFTNVLIIDVRSPIEYSHAHIPNAINIPLFTNEERAAVGTLYKEQGRQVAIKKGLDFFGSKMKTIIEDVEIIISKLGVEKKEKAAFVVVVYCARGGMRSAAVAWLLNLYGFTILVVEGGYKAFRNWVLLQFEQQYPIKILGGYTGSNKTKLLQELSNKTVIIDLEQLANHKGSAFGSFGLPKQTSNELFENKLALQLYKYRDATTIWIEDESQRIGFNLIPKGIWNQMRNTLVYFLQIPFEERLQNIIEEYGTIKTTLLIEATNKIRKQLGGLNTRTAIEHLTKNEIEAAFTLLLQYYDKYYTKGLEQRKPNSIITLTKEEAKAYLISSQSQ